MNGTPLVSVGLAFHNAQQTIEPAIRSILAQTYPHWELIVFDDGSTDQGAELLYRLVAKDPRVKVYRDQKRRGLAFRLNQVIDLANGRYIARMDADDVCYPDRLACQLRFLEDRPDIDLVGTGAMVFAAEGSAIGLFPVRQTHANICAAPLSGFLLAHPTWMGRSEWFRRFRYCPKVQRAQDQELLLRAYRDSRFAALPEPLLGYRQERISLNATVRGRYHYAKALLRKGFAEHSYAFALKGMSAQIFRCSAAVLMSVVGAGDRLVSRRFLTPSNEQLVTWRRVWNLVNSSSSDAKQGNR